MKTKTKQQDAAVEVNSIRDSASTGELLSPQEMEAVLFENADRSTPGPINLPTLSGLGLIALGLLYLLQLANAVPGNIGSLVSVLIFVSGAYILLIGTGFLPRRRSKKPRSRKKSYRRHKGRTFPHRPSAKSSINISKARFMEKRLRKSANKKILGVAGGVAEYFGIDPTWVRIAAVFLALPSYGTAILVYLVLAWAMIPPEDQANTDDASHKD